MCNSSADEIRGECIESSREILYKPMGSMSEEDCEAAQEGANYAAELALGIERRYR